MLAKIYRWVSLTCFVTSCATCGVADDPAAVDRRPVQFMVLLPAAADLEINGAKTTETGDVRRFQSGPLDIQQDVEYLLKATWREGRREAKVERKVTVRGGQSVEVDLYGTKPTADEKAVLDLVNRERARVGAPPLVMDMKLVRAARGHSVNMARLRVIGHTLEGKTFTDRIAAVHYRHGEAGENCAAGSRTPVEATRGWMNSEGHRQNILNARYQETGIGLATGTNGVKYWTQVFAVPVRRTVTSIERRSSQE